MEKISIKIIGLFLIWTVASCDSSETKIRKELEKNCGIVVTHFELIKTEKSQAIGDYIESYNIKLDSVNFKQIISQIRQSKYYDSSFIFESSGSQTLNFKMPKRWIKMPFGYKFEHLVEGTNDMLQCEVDTSKHTIDYIFIEE